MDVIGILRKVVAALAGVAILLLAPPAMAAPPGDDSGVVAASSTLAASHDCCDEQGPAGQGHGAGDCRPGMACHASPAAVPPPADAAVYVRMARVAYLPSPEPRLESRPSDGLLRPPRA